MRTEENNGTRPSKKQGKLALLLGIESMKLVLPVRTREDCHP